MGKRSGGESKPRTPRQQSLAGMEELDIPDLTIAGEEYVEACSERGRAGKRVKDTKASLLEQMRKHKRDKYRLPGTSTMLSLKKGEDDIKIEIKEQPADEQLE
ncbi:MAG: hypothetical protein SF182_01490 [Deltaproteobacteria bacterium]|nr:hypothetical protein [Deltaproteobacteria bacterium]